MGHMYIYIQVINLQLMYIFIVVYIHVERKITEILLSLITIDHYQLLSTIIYNYQLSLLSFYSHYPQNLCWHSTRAWSVEEHGSVERSGSMALWEHGDYCY